MVVLRTQSMKAFISWLSLTVYGMLCIWISNATFPTEPLTAAVEPAVNSNITESPVPAAVVETAPEPSWTTRARVIRVIDGDTIEVEIRRVFRVRLLDCWAPESKQDPRVPENRRAIEKQKGQDAKEYLIRLSDGADVVVQIPLTPDGDVSKVWTMGRVLGRVWLTKNPAQSLNRMMVASGHATTTKPEELR
jgi:endonuclease YncB( thermonuclease family)